MIQRFRWRRRPEYVANQAMVVGLTALATLAILVPVVWMISAGIRPISEILKYPPSVIPQAPTLKYFARIIQDGTYQRYYLNSIIVALVTLLLTVTLAALAAYGFSRFRIRGGRAMLIGILGLLMLPRVTLIIPYFRLAHVVGVYDTLIGLVLVNSAFLLPMAIWLLKGYMDTIPVALEEAALIDGCTRLSALRHVTLPLAIPGLVGVGTFVFVGAWNEYLLAVILTDSPASRTLTIGLASFFGEYVRDWNSIMALATLASLPLVVLFALFQRWVVQGMAAGGVK